MVVVIVSAKSECPIVVPLAHIKAGARISTPVLVYIEMALDNIHERPSRDATFSLCAFTAWISNTSHRSCKESVVASSAKVTSLDDTAQEIVAGTFRTRAYLRQSTMSGGPRSGDRLS